MPARWLTGDEVYGADPELRGECEAHRLGYVLAIGRDRRIHTDAGPIRADELAAGLPRHAWQRLSAGPGAKGQRFYDEPGSPTPTALTATTRTTPNAGGC